MKELTNETFEKLLRELCAKLTEESQQGPKFATANLFEHRVREVLKELVANSALEVDFDPHPYVFPDIVLGKFGVEVKFTTSDTWRSVANSVFESTRNPSVEQIYIVFGKVGGKPGVEWDKYDNCVIHVRTSHVPRFEVQIRPKESLFTCLHTTASFARKPGICFPREASPCEAIQREAAIMFCGRWRIFKLKCAPPRHTWRKPSLWNTGANRLRPRNEFRSG